MLRPLKKAFPSKTGIFGSLLSRAVREPDLACDLALAYEALEREVRKKTIETVVLDALAEGIDISPILIALLAVERDARIARLIATHISANGGETLAPSCQTDAVLAGNEQEGGAVVVRPLFSSFVDVYALAWNSEEGITHALYEPITRDVDVTVYANSLPDDLMFNRVSFAGSVDIVTKVLWNQLKRFGSLSAELYGFVGLFHS